VLIAELGAYRRGEIALLCEILKPSFGIVTFIGTQHIALFGSQEELCRAKAELLDALPADGHAFLNGDSPLCGKLADHCRCSVTIVGTGGTNDLEAFEIEEVPTGIRFIIGQTPFLVPLHGTHNVTNALLAISAAHHVGISFEESAKRLRTFTPPSKTFELRTERGVTILDDTHNSSPASFKAAIAWARTQPFPHKVLLATGLIELGEEQEQTHQELGAQAASVFQTVIFINAKSGEQFAKGFGKTVTSLSRKPSRLLAGSLLVCVGRMPARIIKEILPL
jgi:UDP-N-acetylmuramoyl-tripeptide--D-alanyl-D-alanine ligase